MKVEAIVFDLDGTLLNTVEDIMDSTNEALTYFGFPKHSLNDYYYFIGDGIEELVRRALPEEKRDEETVKKCLERVVKEYHKRWHNKTKPYDGITEMLDYFQKKEMKMAILSNKPQDFTEVTTNYFFKEIKFEAVIGAQKGLLKKPDPLGLIKILEIFGVEKDKVVYLGDTKTDIITAKRGEVIPIGAEWGFRGRDELFKAGAKFIAKTPKDFIKIISLIK